MAFQIKDFASITASMVNWMRASTKKVSDFNIGSVVRTMLEAAAAEIDELYQQMFIGLREAIPVAVYNSFSFSALSAIPASGLVRVSITSSASPTIISAGTVFTTSSSTVSYVATADRTIAAGNTFSDVPVVASVAGIAGNLAANKSFSLAPAPDGFVSATNQSSFINGTDVETSEARKIRFNAFIDSLNRGTVKALQYGLKLTVLTDTLGNETERVVTAAIDEPWMTDSAQPVSLVNCYVHNGSGGTSTALVNKAKDIIYGYTDAQGNKVPGWKAAGVNVQVLAATEQSLAVTAVLSALAGYDKPTLIAAANTAIAEYIRSLDIGATAVKAEIVTIAMNIDGVSNFIASAPAADTTVAKNVKLMPGVINIT